MVKGLYRSPHNFQQVLHLLLLLHAACILLHESSCRCLACLNLCALDRAKRVRARRLLSAVV